ncbi:hypothetical protein PIB30_023843 [Stylosanthes scabra]|uniref:Uncharacterized protein n=1 Tax=Stylosanthes scabra TaxID=79078 RepID=A0ABU6Q9U3_9FABA|nr:hypothetical protein [Stylosanthes scabra]
MIEVEMENYSKTQQIVVCEEEEDNINGRDPKGTGATWKGCNEFELNWGHKGVGVVRDLSNAKKENDRVDIDGLQKTQVDDIEKSAIWKKKRRTFGNGALDFNAFDNDVVVVDAFLLFDEVIVVAILGGGVGRSAPGGGELDLGDKQPLEEGKGLTTSGDGDRSSTEEWPSAPPSSFSLPSSWVGD